MQLRAPAYGQIQDDRIRCQAGFALDDNVKCMAVAATANGVANVDRWRCRAGYRKVDGRCEVIKAPQNAMVMHGFWTCNSGFTQTADGKSCRLVN